jgi:protein-tyrosine-phosphatase
MLGDAGTALHPGLRLARDDAALKPARRVRLLFMCTGNSARSQIAEALASERGGGWVAARSAGSRPKPLHRNAVRVMKDYGIDISGRRSKHLDEFARDRFDFVITLCDRVRERCPEFLGQPSQIHWSIPDPASTGATDRETYEAFRRTAAEINERLGFFLDSLLNSQAPVEVVA